MYKKINYYSPTDRKLLKYLKNHTNKDEGLSIKHISKHLDLNENQIVRSIEKLHLLYSMGVKGDKIYILNTPIDRIIPLEYEDNLKHLNSYSYYFDEIDSTNDFLKKQSFDNIITHGTIAVAEHQICGKGQSNRHWEDKPQMSILMSIFLELNLDVSSMLLLSSAVGLAVCNTIRKKCFINPLIKWPNDIYISEKKCAGILVEGSIMQSTLQNAIIGIGLNVNYELNDFPTDIRNKATSLRIETKTIYNRLNLLNELIKDIDNYIAMIIDGKDKEIIERINKILYQKGKTVIYKGNRYLIDSVNIQGKLVLNKIPSGESIEISSSGELEYVDGY